MIPKTCKRLAEVDYYNKIEAHLLDEAPDALRHMRSRQAGHGPFPIGVVLPEELLPSEEARFQLDLLSKLRSKYHGDAPRTGSMQGAVSRGQQGSVPPDVESPVRRGEDTR